jgi:hypothetical protein
LTTTISKGSCEEFSFVIIPQIPFCQKGILIQYPILYSKDKNIVFVDVDAEILEHPKLFEEIPEKYNVACHILDKAKWYNRDFNGEKEVLSGTLFIRNNEESKKLVNEWIQRCEKSVIWEQKVLQQILQENNIEVFELPIDYCYIVSLPNGNSPFVKCEKPVIVHHQMSRKTKGKIRKDF